jgi:hypothetical protein
MSQDLTLLSLAYVAGLDVSTDRNRGIALAMQL